MNSLCKAFLMAAAVGTSALLGANSARACSEPDCRPPVRLFAPDAYVPGNLVFFKVLSSEPGELSLETASGTKIPASIRQLGPDRVFAPDVPIAAGTQVRLSYRPMCRGSDAAAGAARSYLFTTTSDADLIGVQVGAPEQRERGFYRSSPIDDEQAFVRLVNPVPAVIRHLVDSRAEVDGLPTQFDDAQDDHLTLRASCNPAHGADMDSCGNYRRFTPGRHTVAVHHTVVGGLLELARGEAQIALECDGARKGTSVPN